MGIFFRDGDELVPMREQPYEAEAVLQTLVANYPGLLSGDQDRDREWLLVRQELGVAAAEGGSDRWSLDHLFLDEEGVPTLVEVKRSTDTRMRREVVGQMLDYAANAVAYMDVEKIRSSFEARCEAEGRDADEVVAETLELDEEVADFWDRVKTNLAAGKLRLVFVADRVPSELQRIVEYLNEQMGATEVLALEVKQYAEADGERQTLVSRVIGRTAAAQERKSSGRPSPHAWSEFVETVPERHRPTVQTLFDAVRGAMADRTLDWQPAFAQNRKVAFNRAGGYNAVVILARPTQPVYFQITLPRAPSELGIANPYPQLRDKWKEKWKSWAWEVPSPEEAPDVGIAIDIARRYHPDTGAKRVDGTS